MPPPSPRTAFRAAPPRRRTIPLLPASLLALTLTACTSHEDGYPHTLTSTPAAGQAIRLDHTPSHEPATINRLTYRSLDARNPRQPDAETALAPALARARLPTRALPAPVFVATGGGDRHALPASMADSTRFAQEQLNGPTIPTTMRDSRCPTQ